jgi:hypothetical protein
MPRQSPSRVAEMPFASPLGTEPENAPVSLLGVPGSAWGAGGTISLLGGEASAGDGYARATQQDALPDS